MGRAVVVVGARFHSQACFNVSGPSRSLWNVCEHLAVSPFLVFFMRLAVCCMSCELLYPWPALPGPLGSLHVDTPTV